MSNCDICCGEIKEGGVRERLCGNEWIYYCKECFDDCTDNMGETYPLDNEEEDREEEEECGFISFRIKTERELTAAMVFLHKELSKNIKKGIPQNTIVAIEGERMKITENVYDLKHTEKYAKEIR